MRTLLLIVLALFVAGTATGCGPRMLKTKGKVVKGDQPFLPGKGEFVRVTFVPIFEDGRRVEDAYTAQVNQKKGTFVVYGKDGKGMPPGKYKVVVELDLHRSDRLKGQFGHEKSPFVFDVDEKTDELVLDLANPPK
jgi:hypothetical protein